MIPIVTFLLLAQVTLEDGSPSGADCTKQSIQQQRLAALVALNDAGKVDPAVTNAVLATSWPDDLRPEVTKALDVAIKRHIDGASLNPHALLYFAESNASLPEQMPAYIAAALPEASLGDKYLLLGVACVMPRDSAKLRSAVADELSSRKPVIAIQAASALANIDPENAAALKVLETHLAADSSDILWRAANASGDLPASSDAIRGRLSKLMTHSDVRVRVTAAFSHWRLSHEEKGPLAVLVAGLTQADQPLALGFVYPSNAGDSHRKYIATALGKMRRAKVDALSHLVRILEEEKRGTREGVPSPVAFAALAAIATSGKVDQSTYDHVRELMVGRERSSVYGDYVEELLATMR